jgi:hypothetical protein
MSNQQRAQLLFHGTVILLGGMLTGLPLGVAIADGARPETIHLWAVTHASLVSAGILLIALGAAARHFVLAARQAVVLLWTFVGANYILCLGLVVTAVTGHRGLEPAGPALNVFLHAGNVAGALGALVAGVLLVRGAYGGLSAAARSHLPADTVLESPPLR